MFIGVPIGGSRSYRVRSSDEVNCESKMFKEGLIVRIFGSGYGFLGWYTPEVYSWSMRAQIDMDYSGCNLISYS